VQVTKGKKKKKKKDSPSRRKYKNPDLPEKTGPENKETSQEKTMKDSCIFVRLPLYFSLPFFSWRKRKRRENQTQGAMGGRERALGGGFENGERKGKRD
jgi:hypothetical protein